MASSTKTYKEALTRSLVIAPLRIELIQCADSVELMTYHETISERQDLPEGYESYSLLLIPDERWFEESSESRSFKVFGRFKSFGDSVGPNHLSAWFCYAFVGSYSRGLDLEVRGAVFEVVANSEGAGAILASRSVKIVKGHKLWASYDVRRAKHICASLGLGFNSGPYIAFFDQRPTLPVGPNTKGEFDCGKERPSKPTLVLKFNGMNLDDVLSAINELEFELLRGDVRANRLRATQLRKRLSNACKNVALKIGRTVKLLKDVHDLAEGPKN